VGVGPKTPFGLAVVCAVAFTGCGVGDPGGGCGVAEGMGGVAENNPLLEELLSADMVAQSFLCTVKPKKTGKSKFSLRNKANAQHECGLLSKRSADR
jgi:hypothetical protein